MLIRLSSLALVPALALGATGCAVPTGQQSERARLRVTVQELEAASRAERRRMRDLEYEVARLTTQLGRSAASGADSGTDDAGGRVDADGGALEPVLPVEVLTPDLPDWARSGPDGPADDEEFEVVSSADDGVEIVYVGEAAEDHSVQPDTRHLRATPAHPVTRVAARRPTRTRPRAASLPGDGHLERIPVTDDIGPTVARQLAEAGQPEPASAPRRAPVARTDADDDDDGDNGAKDSAKGDPVAEYSRYYRALKAGNHAFAIAGFGNFIERYPRHSHADNARYWLAEAHYDQRDFRTALAEFSKVERDYPGGNKVPDALLKIGFCHQALGEHEQARARLDELIRRFPRSAPAQLARARLATF